MTNARIIAHKPHSEIGGGKSVKISWPQRKPHWRSYGDGGAFLSLEYFNKNHTAISLDSSEYYTSDKGRFIEKRNMLSLGIEEAEAIQEMLAHAIPLMKEAKKRRA